MQGLQKCTALIPIYNDYESLVVLGPTIKELSSQSNLFLVIDNGSTDHRITEFLQNENIPFVRSDDNLGFGGAILHGAQEVNTQWIAWMPGNLKVNPSDLAKFLDEFRFEPHTFAKAKRVNRKKPDQLKTFIAGAIQSIILGQNMIDTGGTPTVCEKSFLTSLIEPPKDFVFESFTLYAARIRKLHIVRPPFPYGQRVYGHSHWQRGLKSEIDLMIQIIHECLKWKKRNV
jgi:glycosyltransferase involved in cell wall biosynthesis